MRCWRDLLAGRAAPDRAAAAAAAERGGPGAGLRRGQPVVSVDAKKKELVGRFANGGRKWRPSGEPEQVNLHDFPDPTLGKAIPYGVYDLGATADGWVSGPTTTPRRSRSRRCGVGGSRSVVAATRRPIGCWCVRMPAGPKATGAGGGGKSGPGGGG